MKIIERNGSQVLIQDKEGRLWLTKRTKLRHDNRRRKPGPRSVRYIPIKQIPQKGDWLFTCSLKPLQYNYTIIKPEEHRKHYGPMTDERWQEFAEDDFVTLEGSHHSKYHCSLRLVSCGYAEFFNKHELWTLYEKNYQDWELYEKAVKQVCEAFKIKYEGF